MEEQKKISKSTLQRVSLLIVFLVIVVGGFGVWQYYNANKTSQDSSVISAQTNESRELSISVIDENKFSNTYSLSFQEGESAFTMLKRLDSENAGFQFAYKEYPFGAMITSVNGFEPDSTKQFWSFEVNDQMSSEGISSYAVQNNDHITLKLEDVK